MLIGDDILAQRPFRPPPTVLLTFVRIFDVVLLPFEILPAAAPPAFEILPAAAPPAFEILPAAAPPAFEILPVVALEKEAEPAQANYEPESRQLMMTYILVVEVYCIAVCNNKIPSLQPVVYLLPQSASRSLVFYF